MGTLVVLAIFAGLWIARQPADEAPATTLPLEPSIAVLPFVNMSDDAEKEHFADGLSEEVLHKLAGISGLKVVGRTSAFYFKDKDVAPTVIAKTLKVNHLLEGSVRRSGSRVRVTVQLIDARDGYHRWSQTYDREFADIFEIQEDIAQSVAAALQVKLVDADERRLRRRGTRDAEAYRLYVTAITLMNGTGRIDDPDLAPELLKKALARDPEFAAAHAGLARYHLGIAHTGGIGMEENARLGRAEAERAVALDPESSQALAARAQSEAWQYRFRGDFKAYVRMHEDYRRAIELDPSNSIAYFYYGLAVYWDEPEQALSLFDEASDLDAIWELPHGFAASILARRGLFEAAKNRLQQLEIVALRDPDLAELGGDAALDRYLGRLDKAAIKLCPGGPASNSIQCWSTYMSLGDKSGARNALQIFSEDDVTNALREAASFSMDARFEQAFESLDRRRKDFPFSRILDLPTVRLALITGRAEYALELLEARLPDLVRGVEPVRGRNVIPALDLAVAYKAVGRQAEARQLLKRIAAYLDGSDVPRLPMFTYLRARGHALNDEPHLALQALDRAYAEGFRMIWVLDLIPFPLFYIDSIDEDPAFATLKADPRYRNWRERIRADNALQLERLRARQAESPAA